LCPVLFHYFENTPMKSYVPVEPLSGESTSNRKDFRPDPGRAVAIVDGCSRALTVRCDFGWCDVSDQS
jgi:hypothetical protein